METETKQTVQATLEISAEAISDIVVTAVEGSIGYWCRIEGYNWKNPENFGELTPEDEDDFAPTKLTSQTIIHGISMILRYEAKVGNHIRKAILLALVSDDMGEIDGEVADCIVQVGMFNRVYFG